MTGLSQYFGSLQAGQVIPGFFPNNTRFLPCDGVSEQAVGTNNKFLGNMFPKITSASISQATTTGSGFTPQEIAYGNGTYVAVGYSNTATSIQYCSTSTDGRTWVARSMPDTKFWRTVIWTGEYFLAAGDNNDSTGIAIARSEDGITWSSVFTNSSLNVRSLWSYENISFFSNSGGTCWSSTDGLTWNSATVSTGVSGVRAFKGMLYSWYSSGISRSNNGFSWESMTTVGSCCGIETNGTVIIAGSGSANASRISTDGVTWNTITLPGIKNITWNGENFVAFSYSSYNTYYTSPDGTTWTPRTIAASNNSAITGKIVSNPVTGETLVCAGSDYHFVYSISRLWAFEVVPIHVYSPNIATMIHTGTRYIATGRLGNSYYPLILTSDDGLNWKQRDVYNCLTVSSFGIDCLAMMGNTIIGSANGSMNYIISTDGGLTWDMKQFNYTNGPSIACNGTVFLQFADGSTSYATSTDGITWTNRVAPQNIHWVAANGSTFLTTYYNGSNTSYKTSTDGINWATPAAAAQTGDCRKVYPFKTMFMSFPPATGQIMYAPGNVASWTTVSLNVSLNSGTRRLMLSAGMLIAYTESLQSYSHSTDGINWTTKSWSVASNQFYAAAGTAAGEYVFMRYAGDRCSRTTDPTTVSKWSFYANWTVAPALSSVSYSVRLADRSVSQSGYKIDGDSYWKTTYLPGHNSLATSGAVLGSNGTAVVSAVVYQDASWFYLSIAYSESGQEWTLSDLIQISITGYKTGMKAMAPVYDGTYWYIFFNAGFFYRSADGKSWTRFTCPFTVGSDFQIAVKAGRLLIIPDKVTVAPSASEISYYYTSTDYGANWTRVQSPMRQASYVTYGDLAGFMMFTYAGDEYRLSTDGLTWSGSKNVRSSNNTVQNGLTGIEYVNNTYVILTGAGMNFSQDGLTWSSRPYNISPSNMLRTSITVDGNGVVTTESVSVSAPNLTTTITKVDPTIIKAPLYTAGLNAVAPSYSLVTR